MAVGGRGNQGTEGKLLGMKPFSILDSFSQPYAILPETMTKFETHEFSSSFSGDTDHAIEFSAGLDGSAASTLLSRGESSSSSKKGGKNGSLHGRWCGLFKGNWHTDGAIGRSTQLDDDGKTTRASTPRSCNGMVDLRKKIASCEVQA